MRMTEQERRIRIRHLKRMYRIRERKERHDKKVSGLFMKRVVFTLILAAFIFTVVMIFVFLRMGSEPSTLIENVFRFLSVEGGAMALIKSVKTVKGTKSNGEIQHMIAALAPVLCRKAASRATVLCVWWATMALTGCSAWWPGTRSPTWAAA